MNATSELDEFLHKWRARWPEWRIAQTFVHETQRERAEAWFALLQEFTDAAWGGTDPMPGTAKLAWWQEELRGWARGGRRHPLGLPLQKMSAPWSALAASLAVLQDTRSAVIALLNHDANPSTQAKRIAECVKSFAEAIDDCEHALFDDQQTARQASDYDCGIALIAAHALMPTVDAIEPQRVSARNRALLTAWPQSSGSRPRRVYDALIRGRLRRSVSMNGNVNAVVQPLPPFAVLWASWRAARG